MRLQEEESRYIIGCRITMMPLQCGLKNANVFLEALSEVFSGDGGILISWYKAVVKTLFRTLHTG